MRYYAHFLKQEGAIAEEFKGTVVLSATLPKGDTKQAVQLLAKEMHCKPKDISLIEWSLLH